MRAEPQIHATGGGGAKAWLLLVPVFLFGAVLFWEVMARRSRREFTPFEVTEQRFAGFVPAGSQWRFDRVPIRYQPLEPNIMAFQANMVPGAPQALSAGGVRLRVVHGYNLVDCMRIKGYAVQLKMEDRSGKNKRPFQVWEMVSSMGERTIWVSTIVKAEDLCAASTDVRHMAFPRVGTPDALGAEVRGLSRESLRHPVQSLRLFLRAQWNASRCDWKTFLRLRKPVWASDELLTVVTLSTEAWSKLDDAVVVRSLLEVHDDLLRSLEAWHVKTAGD
jgi:hypothetical protein